MRQTISIHFLLQVDMKGALTKRLDSLSADLRTVLRDKNLRHAGVNREGDRLIVKFRDAETRVMFSGYNPVYFKLFIWTLSAVICGIAGALYVPQVGIINPGEMSPANSIEIAIWAAVGGRGTLVGPILGAFVVNGAKSWFTVAFPEFWLFFLGLTFILVTLFLPHGVVGLLRRRGPRDS